MEPKITAISDYDGFFEKLVKSWVANKLQSKQPFKHKEIQITAGPFRPAAVQYKTDGCTIHLDFYSALRVGFGSLSDEDAKAITDLL